MKHTYTVKWNKQHVNNLSTMPFSCSKLFFCCHARAQMSHRRIPVGCQHPCPWRHRRNPRTRSAEKRGDMACKKRGEKDETNCLVVCISLFSDLFGRIKINKWLQKWQKKAPTSTMIYDFLADFIRLSYVFFFLLLFSFHFWTYQFTALVPGGHWAFQAFPGALEARTCCVLFLLFLCFDKFHFNMKSIWNETYLVGPFTYFIFHFLWFFTVHVFWLCYNGIVDTFWYCEPRLKLVWCTNLTHQTVILL